MWHAQEFMWKEILVQGAVSSPLKERINLNCALHHSVDLIDFGHDSTSKREFWHILVEGGGRDLENILLQRIQMVVSLEGELWGQQCARWETAKINQEWYVISIFVSQQKMVYLDIEIPLDYIKDRLKLCNIVQHRTTICTCMYLEAEVARKLFLPYEIKKFERKKKSR